MALRVVGGIIHRRVTAPGHVDLLVSEDVGVILPTGGRCIAALMRRGQRVGRPEGSIVRVAVIVAIVPVCLRVAAAAVEHTHVVLAARCGRQFQPSGGDVGRCRRSGEGARIRTLNLYLSTAVPDLHVGLVVVLGVGGEAGYGCREGPVGAAQNI